MSPPLSFALLCPATFVLPPSFWLLCPATFVSPPPCFSSPCWLRLLRLLLGPLCRRRLPLSSLCCMRFCGYICDVCVAASLSPLLDLLYAFSAATFATIVSPPPSCLCSPCCLRYSRLLLRPLCRRRLLSSPRSVACGFAATSATFVSPPPSRPSSFSSMRFGGYLLRPLCRCLLLFLPRAVVCVFAATSATLVSPPLCHPTLLCCTRFCGCFCDLCVAAAFVFASMSRDFCVAAFVLASMSRNLCVAASLLFLSLLVASFAATSGTFVSPPPSPLLALLHAVYYY